MIFFVALAVRLIVAYQLWDLPIVRTPKLDSAEYVAWARRMASGDFSWPVVSPHGPGYPLFLAALFAVSGGSLKFAIAAQAVVGATTALLVASLARDWFGERGGWLAGLAYALYGPAVYVETALLGEGLLVFLLTLALWLVGRPKGLHYNRPGVRSAGLQACRSAGLQACRGAGLQACLAGAALGLATLVRPTAIVFALALAIWIAGRTARALLPFALAFVLVLAPAFVKNGSLSLQGYGGLNVYIGDSPLHTGRPTFRLGAGWDALNSEAVRAGVTDPAAQDRYYLRKTLHEIWTAPGAFARLLGVKLLWLLQAQEVRDSHSFYFFAEQSPVLRVLPRWAILFPLACVGAFGTARLKPRAPSELPRPPSGRSASLQASVAPLAHFAFAGVATVVFLVVGTRYRMPLVPALAIAAGAACEVIPSSLAAAAIVGAGAIAISHVVGDPRNTNVAEEWAFTGSSLITERDLTGATAAYHRALQLDPASGLAWDGLALAQYDDGKLAEARASVNRALAGDPDNGRARYHLGLIDEQEKKFAAAVDDYRRAVALSPYDADAAVRLATALGMTGRTGEARDAMRRALLLDPRNGEAWLDLCLLLIDGGDVNGAAGALQRAEELGANPQKVAFASRALGRARERPDR